MNRDVVDVGKPTPVDADIDPEDMIHYEWWAVPTWLCLNYWLVKQVYMVYADLVQPMGDQWIECGFCDQLHITVPVFAAYTETGEWTIRERVLHIP